MQNEPAQPLEPVIRRTRWHVSVVWIVPIVSALIALSLFVRHVRTSGPTIQVLFQTAEGLEAGKTQVKYKDVPIGTVANITVSDDLTHVIVSVDLQRSAKSFAQANTRFWVVRPRVGMGGISGIGTILSGAYIGADPGKAGEQRTVFTGMEVPPAITSESHGSQFSIHSDDLGSLDLGSPVYYRRLKVGTVVSYALDQNGEGVTFGIFIDTPNDRLVTRSSRFWNASGIDVSLGADGLKLRTQSLASVASGGLAFMTPIWARNDRTPAPSGSRFDLLQDEKTAMDRPSGQPQYVSMKFGKSLRGLSVDAPVEFIGVEIGRVVSITIDYEAKTQRFPVVVGALIYPEKLGRVFQEQESNDPDNSARHLGTMMSEMVARGLRAQARNGNLLTGQLYIALDFLPNASKVAFDGMAQPLQIPTTPGALDNVQEQISSIVAKIDKVPFESLGHRLDQNLGELSTTLTQLNSNILPEFTRTLGEAHKTLGAASEALSENSPLQRNAGQALKELERSARSLRVLAEYLSRHPESLIRGRPTDMPPSLALPTQSSAPRTGEP